MLRIVRKESHDTGDPWPHLEVGRSKVKDTRPINAVTENQPYLRNGKAYDLRTWSTDGVERLASASWEVSSKLKAVAF